MISWHIMEKSNVFADLFRCTIFTKFLRRSEIETNEEELETATGRQYANQDPSFASARQARNLCRHSGVDCCNTVSMSMYLLM
jgi:hypothetical protein